MTIATTDTPAADQAGGPLRQRADRRGTYGTVQLLVEFYPQLAAVGGAITLQLGKEIASTTTRGYSVPIDNTILLINQSAARSTSPCSRAARTRRCPLGYNEGGRQQIECPCHSSRFQANPGAVLRRQVLARARATQACSAGR